MKYEYLKKRELYNRAKRFYGLPIPAIGFFSYEKSEGVEWMTSGNAKIMAQRNGGWLQISCSHYDESTDSYISNLETFSGYNGESYQLHYSK